jgi:hypothetical protein
MILVALPVPVFDQSTVAGPDLTVRHAASVAG